MQKRGKTALTLVGFAVMLAALLAVALLPLGLNVIYLLASGNVHILMQHALFLVYTVPLLLFSGLELPKPPRALWGWCTVALCAFLLVRMAICSNGAYVYTKLVYDQSARQMTTIMAKVQQLPGYEEGVTPVAFVGEFTDSAFAYHDPAFSRYEEGDLHQVNSAITYDGTIKAGVDLEAAAVSISGDTVTVTLPETEILAMALPGTAETLKTMQK